MAQSDDSLTDADGVLAVPEVTTKKGTLDFRNQNGEISGNVYAGAVVRGDRDVRIGGTVSGNSQHKCVIEVSGTVEIASAVTCARIQARKIVIRGNVEDSMIQSDLDVEVHGNLATSQVTLGGASSGNTKIEADAGRGQAGGTRVGNTSSANTRCEPKIYLSLSSG